MCESLNISQVFNFARKSEPG